MEPVPSTVVKTYPKRGPLQQFRFAESTAFRCFRCGDTKRSRLITTYGGNWARRLCNGCYGCLLSLYEIKTANKTDYERAEALAAALVSAVTVDERRQVEHIYRTAEKRAQHLTAEAVRFIATAEHVARQLLSDPQLEWSPAVIGLCKAVEAEVLHRILIPLANRAAGHAELDADKTDKDLGRVAGFCAKPSRKPPELGVFAHFLQTVIHSQQRRGTSAIIRSFLGLASDWTGSDWILNPGSFHRSLVTLTMDYRNRAAHVDELAKSDYLGCRDLAIGSSGIIWRLIVATERHR